MSTATTAPLLSFAVTTLPASDGKFSLLGIKLTWKPNLVVAPQSRSKTTAFSFPLGDLVSSKTSFPHSGWHPQTRRTERRRANNRQLVRLALGVTPSEPRRRSRGAGARR